MRRPCRQLTIARAATKVSLRFVGSYLHDSSFHSNLQALPRPVEDYRGARILREFFALPPRVVGIEYESGIVEFSQKDGPC